MPTFDFQCTNCNHAAEHWVRKHNEIIKCSECSHVMKKQVGGSNLGGMDSLGRSK